MTLLSSEIGCIRGMKNDGAMVPHLQGIAHAGEYTVLSSSIKDAALIVAPGTHSKKKIMYKEKNLPNGYKHPGGIGVLPPQSGENSEWMIFVPVFGEGGGAIIPYRLNYLKNGKKVSLKCEDSFIICLSINAMAYAVGIARMEKQVIMAVVIDNNGNQVLFLEYNTPTGLGRYKPLNGTWNADAADKDKWQPDKTWGGYPNSISLIYHDRQLYFVGMHQNTTLDDWIDIYDVNLDNHVSKRLIKKCNARAICQKGASFRWGEVREYYREKMRWRFWLWRAISKRIVWLGITCLTGVTGSRAQPCRNLYHRNKKPFTE